MLTGDHKAEISSIPFQGGEILTTKVDGKPHVVFRHAVESIGLDPNGQLAKMRNRSWFSCCDIAATAADGKTYKMVAVTVESFLMWLATVNETKVAEHVRDRLVTYQRESAAAIYGYWAEGGAINPRATEDQLESLSRRCRSQIDLLAAAKGLVEPAWLEAKTRHVLARGLGEEPEIDPASRPLTVGDFLADRGITGAAQRGLSTRFGKRLTALYQAKHGEAPKKVERFVDGALRQVCGYTEVHRPLFEQALADLGG
jgi:hypothetical protein